MAVAAPNLILPRKHSFISIAPKHSKCPNQFRIRFLAGYHMWCTVGLGPQPSAMTHSRGIQRTCHQLPAGHARSLHQRTQARAFCAAWPKGAVIAFRRQQVACSNAPGGSGNASVSAGHCESSYKCVGVCSMLQRWQQRVPGQAVQARVSSFCQLPAPHCSTTATWAT